MHIKNHKKKKAPNFTKSEEQERSLTEELKIMENCIEDKMLEVI